MKKNLHSFLIASLMLTGLVSSAQPMLTASGINFVIGESLTYYNCPYADTGSPGTNQIWDLSSMTVSTSLTSTIVTPTSTSNGSSFPNSNVALSSSNGANYFNTSATALRNCGVVSSNMLMAYSDPEDMLHFPFTYSNTYTDTWATQFLNNGYMFYRKGTSTSTADGYGTLITPSGTYTDVLRVHMVQNYQDSADFGMPYIVTYTMNQYMWYKEGTHFHIAYIYNLNSSAGGPYTGGSYLSGTVGLDHLSDKISSSGLFPNPASDKLTINLTLTENQKIEVRLFNSMGQQLEINQMADGIQGANTMLLDIDKVPEGIYFAQIWLNGNLASTKRFVISK